MADAIFRTSPLVALSFTPVEAIAIPANGAGLLVEARVLGANLGRRACGVAAVNSQKVVGVAKFDVPAARATIQGPQVGDEHRLSVYSGVIALVTLASAAVEGDLLIPAAAGQVSVPAAVSGTYVQAEAAATRAIVGRALQAGASGAAIEAWIKPMGVP